MLGQECTLLVIAGNRSDLEEGSGLLRFPRDSNPESQGAPFRPSSILLDFLLPRDVRVGTKLHTFDAAFELLQDV